MTRRLIALLGVLALTFTACGNDDETDVAVEDATTTTEEVDVDADRPDYLGGYDVDFETGAVDIAAYAAFLDEHGGPADGPEAAALELLGDTYAESLDMGTEEQVSSVMADGGRTVVTVIYDGLPDDSVTAVRYEFVFIGGGADLIVESASWASRCQPNRGHQDWDTGLCL